MATGLGTGEILGGGGVPPRFQGGGRLSPAAGVLVALEIEEIR
jgi:hypothetical protein